MNALKTFERLFCGNLNAQLRSEVENISNQTYETNAANYSQVLESFHDITGLMLPIL